MKTVILAGGLGTRLAEETGVRPKPMVEIGGQPILWHIMNIYAHYGCMEFLVALGYKGELIKQYFLDFRTRTSHLYLDLASGETRFHGSVPPPWKVHLIETGAQTMTGGRILRMREHIGDDPLFMVTYGDGVADVDLGRLLAFHRAHGKLATVTAVRPPARFGDIRLQDGRVMGFAEKPQVGEGWINGGFFVLDRRVLDYIDGDATIWEREPMERLVAEGQLMAYCHEGFWQPMDTIRERTVLEGLWASGNAPWKIWD
ncbi:glucose-1-phosphate cytidylyltransferase [Mesoterricola sediminis]|uniref:glucose-1-phosphate cytidylyltransferase n=1 Tax=Mesoterricola sediminis TaxID=2927980 RepID=UPI001FB00F45